jgi:hypothetical protein
MVATSARHFRAMHMPEERYKQFLEGLPVRDPWCMAEDAVAIHEWIEER